MADAWEVLEVPDALCAKVVGIVERFCALQGPEVYLMGDGPLRLCVDEVMFDVGFFYDGYHRFARFDPKEGIKAVRKAVVGCSPYHPRYETFVAHVEGERLAEKALDERFPLDL